MSPARKAAATRARRNGRAFTIVHPDGRIVRFGKLRADGTRKVRTLVNA